MKPIGSSLSGQRLQLAELQDYVIDLIYDDFQHNALLYGGTAIWRCFGGKRFSEDIDIYLDSTAFDDFISSLEGNGMRLIWQDPEFPSRVKIARNEIDILLESKPGFAENEIRAYSRTDGSVKTLSVLSPTELMVRKIEAYQGRRLIRDIYDLFILTGWLDNADYTVKTELSNFLQKLNMPVDEGILSSLLYAGARDLNFVRMVDYIKRWVNEV